MLTPHCLYTYKQAKNVVLILDTIIHVEGSKFSCCNCTAVNRNTCRCNKAKTFSCEAYREYKFAISACCASDNSPLLLHANGKPLHTNIVTMIVIFPVEAISSYRVTFGKQTRSASVQAKNIDKIYNALKGNRESNASFRFSG